MLLVVGPSGSGKSTLARAVAGLLPSQFPGRWQGSLRVGEVEVARSEATGDDSTEAPPVEPAADADLPALTTADLGAGIVLQDPASQLVMERVGDDVAFGLENLAWPLAAMRQRVPQVLEQVGLSGFQGRRSTRLSGGEQQRLAIAGVLAPDPSLLVLDEPTANLDPAGAASVFAILADLRARRAATVVLVEHRASLAWPLADLVLALDDDGRPIDVGSPAEVLARSGPTLERAGIWLPEQVPGSEALGADEARADHDGPGEPGSGRRAVVGSLPILEMAGVRFGFEPNRPVLRDIDLTVAPGDRVALVGPNGSGKTTLLRLAMGLLRPNAGMVRLGARDPSRLPVVQLARLAGYVVHDPELGFLADTVQEEVELGLELEQLRYARELCERLRLPLEAFGDRSPYRLSGGEQRRLSLVTGLARRPLLLALDEPTYGQDRRGHDALVAALDELVEQGTAMLAATHDERFVGDAADRRIELADGWIVGDDVVSRAFRPAPARGVAVRPRRSKPIGPAPTGPAPPRRTSPPRGAPRRSAPP